jgi:hypothetical protein
MRYEYSVGVERLSKVAVCSMSAAGRWKHPKLSATLRLAPLPEFGEGLKIKH